MRLPIISLKNVYVHFPITDHFVIVTIVQHIQMRAENQPIANDSCKVEEAAATDHTPQSRGRIGSTSSIIRKLMEKVVKPKPPQTIHSGTISEEERHSTLAPFTIPGIAIEKVNRDYEAFFKTAWGTPSTAPKSSAANLPQPSAAASSALVQPPSQHGQAEREHREGGSRRERKTEQLRSHRPTNVAGERRGRAFTAEDDLKDKPSSSRSPPRSPQLRKAKQLNTPEVCEDFWSMDVVISASMKVCVYQKFCRSFCLLFLTQHGLV